jgi:hypothetical protein
MVKSRTSMKAVTGFIGTEPVYKSKFQKNKTTKFFSTEKSFFKSGAILIVAGGAQEQ